MRDPDDLTEALWMELHGDHPEHWVEREDGEIVCEKCRFEAGQALQYSGPPEGDINW